MVTQNTVDQTKYMCYQFQPCCLLQSNILSVMHLLMSLYVKNYAERELDASVQRSVQCSSNLGL